MNDVADIKKKTMSDISVLSVFAKIGEAVWNINEDWKSRSGTQWSWRFTLDFLCLSLRGPGSVEIDREQKVQPTWDLQAISCLARLLLFFRILL